MTTTTWKTALLDPPWEERGSGKIKRGAQRHYDLLKTAAMPGVIRASGLWTPDENAHVYCWVTNNFLPDGLWLLNELGARYITNIAWTKKRPGIGRYFRGKHELLLFATIGRGWAVRTSPNDIESTLDTSEKDGDGYFPDGDSIEAEHEMVNGKRKHSAKPKVFYDMIESRSLGPYVEFFARSLRPGWTSWGNDAAVVASAVAISQSKSDTVAGPEPEPAPKKARAKKSSPPTEEDRLLMAEAGGTTVAELPVGAAEAARDIREAEEQLGSKPIRVGSGILEVLDALGVPHVEGPRQMFEVEVSDAPLPAMEGPGIVAQLEELFAHTQTEGYLAAIADEKSGVQPKLDGGFPTGPLPGGPTKHLPQPDLAPPPRPPSCPHGEPRSACVLCRARR
jgi:N6-adenosine-specific RNA methylase IME4